MKPGDEIIIKNKKFVVESIRAEHTDHVSVVATWSGRIYLVRYYETGFEEAMASYKVLKKSGINMAKVCFHDDEKKIIAFDYFPEDDVLCDLSKGPLSELHFQAMFALWKFARLYKVALSWGPQNFMLRGSQMFYLPLKWSPLEDNTAFEKEGIRSWFRGPEGIAILKKKGYDVDGIVPMDEASINKAIALLAVKYR